MGGYFQKFRKVSICSIKFLNKYNYFILVWIDSTQFSKNCLESTSKGQSPDAWWFNNNALNLFLKSALKSEFNKETHAAITFVPAILLFKTSPFRLFHREQDLKTKLFL